MESLTPCKFCSEISKGSHKCSCRRLLEFAQTVDLHDSGATFEYVISPQDQVLLDSIKVA